MARRKQLYTTETAVASERRQAPWRQWGHDLDAQAVTQMEQACSLPVALAGALMPDAHVGYGLPIGGVLAADNAVIPYAVGVDIACRMHLTLYDLPAARLAGLRDRLVKTLEAETRFGVGSSFRQRRSHDVMDRNWSISPVTKGMRDTAWAQLGTSGSGNHFVEFGAFTIAEPAARELNLPAGAHLALLSHSGSRGTGARVCNEYSKRAMNLQQNLPRHLKHLAWLPLNSSDGQEYWAAMSLMGHYAAANHELIHHHITKALGFKTLYTIDNHHNFAWRETHQIAGRRREVIVHRKGATPAASGQLGVIPGSMTAPGYLVRGKGNREALHSAAHGAGRVMSRSQAKQTLTWSQLRRELAAAGVELLSAGLDESPSVYKDIETVMTAQQELVEILGRFDPKLVKMSPAGERAED